MAYDRGPQLFDPGQMVGGGGYSYATGITAHAGGTRAAAVPLTAASNQVSVCATNADSVSLPPAVGGQVIYVGNAGAATLQVFAAPGTSDTINTVVAATGVAVATTVNVVFFSPAAGVWRMITSA